MRQISAQVLDEAALEELESGRRLIPVRSGTPLAEIVPLPQAAKEEPANEQRRLQAVQRLKQIMAKGFDIGVEWNGRDELYDHHTQTISGLTVINPCKLAPKSSTAF